MAALHSLWSKVTGRCQSRAHNPQAGPNALSGRENNGKYMVEPAMMGRDRRFRP